MTFRLPKKSVSTFEQKYRERESRARLKKRREPHLWIEAERVKPVLLQWMEKHQDPDESKDKGLTKLSFASGIPTRTLYRIVYAKPTGAQRPRGYTIAGGERFISLDTVDRLFIGMGCTNLLYRQPTNDTKTDGFADVYFHPCIDEEELAKYRQEALHWRPSDSDRAKVYRERYRAKREAAA